MYPPGFTPDDSPQDLSGFTPDEPALQQQPEPAPASPEFTSSIGEFIRGAGDFGKGLYNQVNTIGKTGAQQIRQGNYSGAFNTVTSPLTGAMQQVQQKVLSGNLRFPTAEAGSEGFNQIAGIAGLPGPEMQEAWKTGNYPRLAGQLAGALALHRISGSISGRGGGESGGPGIGTSIGKIRDRVRAGFNPETPTPSTPEQINQSMVEARQRADQTVRSTEPLLKPEEIPSVKQRYYELMHKATKGLITPEEIAEGMDIDKKLRAVNFGETGTEKPPEQARPPEQPPEMQLQYQEPNPAYPGDTRVSEAPPDLPLQEQPPAQEQQLPESWQQFTPDRLRSMGVTPAERPPAAPATPSVGKFDDFNSWVSDLIKGEKGEADPDALRRAFDRQQRGEPKEEQPTEEQPTEEREHEYLVEPEEELPPPEWTAERFAGPYDIYADEPSQDVIDRRQKQYEREGKRKTLDEVEANKRTPALVRLGRLIGEDRASQLATGEKQIEYDEPASRSHDKKSISAIAIDRWGKWAKDELSSYSVEPENPGITENNRGEWYRRYYPKRFELVYRDANGKPIGIVATDMEGEGITRLAVSPDLGLRRGKVAFELLKQAFDRGVTEPSGGTSDLTKNLIERIRRLASGTKGELDLDAIYDAINKMMSGVKGFFGEEGGAADIGRLRALFEKQKTGELTPEELSEAVKIAKEASTEQESAPKLPKGLTGAKSRFNMGGDSYEPRFASDLDKALYIIAGKGRSKAHNDYLQFVMDTLGVDESTAVGLGHQVKSAVRQHVINEQPGVVDIPDTGIGVGLKRGAFTPDEIAGEPPEPPDYPELEAPPTPEEIPKKRPDKAGPLQALWDLPRGMMSVDLPFITSAAFRQGSGYVGTARWFKAFAESARAYGSEATSNLIYSEMMKDPLNRPTEEPVFNKEGKPVIDKETGKQKTKMKESYTERMGLRIGDLDKYSTRDEGIRGDLAERIPYYGKVVRASNRAFNTFINSIAFSTFKMQVENAVKLAKTPEENPMLNEVLGKNMAEAVNTTVKRGRLGFEVGPWEVNMEKGHRILGNVFFSARNIASEVRMLNLSTYVMAEPAVRRIYLTAVARRVTAWAGMATLASIAGAKVSLDPTNSDFGKIRIGNTRIDPPGGLSQYIVLISRLARGGSTSSTSGAFTPYGKGYKPQTRKGQVLDFGLDRLHPSAGYLGDLGSATRSSPVGLGDRTLQLAMPMFSDDLADVGMKHPELALGVAILGSAGMGSQSYDRKSFKKSRFIPPKYDIMLGRK
jgi:hypothetical protein